MMNKMWMWSCMVLPVVAHADAVTDLHAALENGQAGVSALVAHAVKENPKSAEALVSLAVKKYPDQAADIALAAAKADPNAVLTVAKSAYCAAPKQAGAIAKAIPQAKTALADWVCVASIQPEPVGQTHVADSTQNGATAANNSTLLLQSGSESQVNSALMYQQIINAASPNQPD